MSNQSNKILGRITKVFDDGREYFFMTDLDINADPAHSYFGHVVNVISGVPERHSIVRFVPRETKKGWAAYDMEIFKTRVELHAADLVAAAATDPKEEAVR